MSSKGSIEALARPEISALAAYVPASYREGLTRLNANEAPWQSASDATERGLNRYPEARPGELTRVLATHYGVSADSLFVTRGTSEAIDLLIRCFCRPGVDEVIICPPTFGMYQVYADIQNAGIVEIPLDSSRDFALPVTEILNHWRSTSRLVFVTTPNNPTGHALDVADIRTLAQSLASKGIVVIDGAYVEFADPHAVMALLELENVVVLRTMSKAYGLAGARCGALIGDPRVIELVAKVMPPYALPTPSNECALAALANESFTVMPERIRSLCVARERMAGELGALRGVRRVWPSSANFLLVEFDDPAAILDAAESAGYLLRDFSEQPVTRNCLRITIGNDDDNHALLESIKQVAG